MAATTPRAGKELVIATKAFAVAPHRTSWRHVLVTLAALVACLAGAALLPWWPVRIALSALGSLLMVRAFIFFHDFHHGALLRGAPLARGVLNTVGLLMLVPPRSWRESHNYHHANVAKVDAPAIGSFPVMSVEAWRRATRWERFKYRATRHPLTILAAGLTVFGLTVTLVPLLRSPRRYWDSAVALLLHAGVVTGLWWWGGADVALLGFVLPYAAASAMGAYLFYAQHNFPGLRMLQPDQWTPYRAALESCSYLRTGPVLAWFTGNIGYHHVHHLNPAIPFYRLPEAMAALPELQHPVETSFRPRDVVACFRGNVWDEASGAMVGYRAAGSPSGDAGAHPGRRASGAGAPPALQP